MGTLYWDGSADTDYSNTANWSTGAVPGAGDDVIFDGRVATGPISNLAEADDLGSVHIMKSFTGNIGTSSVYWEFQCSGTVVIEGSGTYHIRCGNGSAANHDIANMVINSTGTVNLASELNNNSNSSSFTSITVSNGTVNLKGKADIATSGGQDGTPWGFLKVTPTSGASPVVTIGDHCENERTDSTGQICQTGGTVNCHSGPSTLDLYGGTFNFGSTSYTLATDDDGIATANIYSGTFNWLPSVVSGGVRTTASATPVINTLNLFSGTFNATSMLETLTDAPTITAAIIHGPSTFNIANGFSNIVVSSCVSYGATIQTSAKQALTIS